MSCRQNEVLHLFYSGVNLCIYPNDLSKQGHLWHQFECFMCENCKHVKLINHKLPKYVIQFEVDISNYIGYIELFNTVDLQFDLLSVANL
jgi:hypothetical protein